MTVTSAIFILTVVSLLEGRAQAEWTLSWSDEFDGATNTSPDESKWGYDIGDNNGWGNDEREYYTSNTSNVALDGSGNLAITARNDDAGQYQCYYGQCEYTSGRILTKGKFEQQYGKFEARIKTPSGKGMWPAFWMLGGNIDTVPWPDSGNIDIMELRGSIPNSITGKLQGPGYSGEEAIIATYDLPNGTFSEEFHVFTCEWTETTVTLAVDEVVYLTINKDQGPLQGKQWVFDHPFFILLSVAVGGSFDGYPDQNTVFPQTMSIDYVRVYSQN